MAIVINGVEIERGKAKAWPFLGPFIQPSQQLIDSRRFWHVAIELQPAVRAHAAHRRFAARPEHGGGGDAGLFSGHPDRFGIVPPAAILHRAADPHRKGAKLGIPHIVVDDAVAIRPQACHQRVVIGEGERREAWSHRVGSDTARRQRRDVGAHPAAQIIGAQAINGDEDDRMRGLFHGGGGCRRRGVRRAGRQGKGQEAGEEA